MYSGLPQSQENDSAIRKRKRDSEERMDVEETPYTLLRSQVSPLSKALLQQLKSRKTPPPTLQAGFQLLHALLGVLPGCLSHQITPITTISQSLLLQSPATSTSALHLTCLSFIALYFATHAPGTFSVSLPSLSPVLLKSVGEKHPRVLLQKPSASFSALLNATRPTKSGEWAEHFCVSNGLCHLTKLPKPSQTPSCATPCARGALPQCALPVSLPEHALPVSLPECALPVSLPEHALLVSLPQPALPLEPDQVMLAHNSKPSTSSKHAVATQARHSGRPGHPSTRAEEANKIGDTSSQQVMKAGPKRKQNTVHASSWKKSQKSGHCGPPAL
ncbi:hypothetical protein BD769DRAFT_1664858 [Suillus cothurnatus]|nr:hypothetical protein BD769DRAFT_1664858 [Suillus cothurnatus]